MFAFSILELTIREIVSELPHDLGALIAYFVLAVFAAFIVYGSRNPEREENSPADLSGDS